MSAVKSVTCGDWPVAMALMLALAGRGAPETRGGGGPAGSVGQPAADVGVDGADPGLAEVHCAVVGVEPHMAVLVPLVRGVDAGHAVHCHVDPRSVHVDVQGVARARCPAGRPRTAPHPRRWPGRKAGTRSRFGSMVAA